MTDTKTASGFTPRATRQENLTQAYEWLDRAVRLEGEGKSASMVNMAFNRALQFEDHAFTLPGA